MAILPSDTNALVKQQRAFTLLEMIIALALFSTLLLFMYRLLINSSQTVKTVEQTVKLQREAESLINGLIKELQVATEQSPELIPPPGGSVKTSSLTGLHLLSTRATQGFSEIFFTAGEAGIYLPGRQNSTGLVQIGYQLQPNPESPTGLSLTRIEMPLISPPDQAYKQKLIFPLSHQVTSFRLRFYNHNSRRWFDQWTRSEASSAPPGVKLAVPRLPDLVELQITFSPLGQEITPTNTRKNGVNQKSFTTLISLKRESN